MAFGNATKGYVRAHSSDYSQLSNKPSINGVTLSGNKTSTELNISSLETYSRDETVVGTWIDGSPIYQKVITGTEFNVSSGWAGSSWTDVSSLSIDKLIDVVALGRDSNGTAYPVLTQSKCWAISSSGILSAAPDNNSVYIDTIILKYTKTEE